MRPMDTETTPKQHPDAALIDFLGGPATVARMLGFDPKGGTQRVQNWKSRGIPEVVKLRRPDVFGPAPAAAEAPGAVDEAA